MSPEEVGKIWNSIPKPSYGKVESAIADLGGTINRSTIRRFKLNGWKPSKRDATRGPHRIEDIPAKAERALKQVVKKVPSKVLRELVDRAFAEGSITQKSENFKKAFFDAMTVSSIIFAHHTEFMITTHPTAFAAGISAFADIFRSINEPPAGKVIDAILAKDVTPRNDDDDRELREFLADPV